MNDSHTMILLLTQDLADGGDRRSLASGGISITETLPLTEIVGNFEE
jgi:hypothetical protein